MAPPAPAARPVAASPPTPATDSGPGRRCQCVECPSQAREARVARRHLLKDAVFRHAGAVPAGASRFAGVAFGTVTDASPGVLVLDDSGTEQRYVLTDYATVWRGGPLSPAELQPGDRVIVRHLPGQRRVADRIWANIGRVTGTIVERGVGSPISLLVDVGITRPKRLVLIPSSVASQIEVRFPKLAPGYLIDVIGLVHAQQPDVLEALVPATAQPARPSVAHRRSPASRPADYVSTAISGSATWTDQEDREVLGVRYPALDPETGCAEGGYPGPAHGGADRNRAAGYPADDSAPAGWRRLPFLALGSRLLIRNHCAGSSAVLPVTGCAPSATFFNDRCVTCGTSPRGRVAVLTPAAFVALGGELERACFNAAITIGR